MLVIDIIHMTVVSHHRKKTFAVFLWKRVHQNMAQPVLKLFWHVPESDTMRRDSRQPHDLPRSTAGVRWYKQYR